MRSSLSIGAAIFLAMIGATFFNLQPLILAAAQPVYSLTDAQLGWLAAAELSGFALASLFLIMLVSTYRFSLIVGFGLSSIAILNGITLFTESYWQLIATRFFTGLLGEGPVYISAILMLGRSTSPTRLFGLMVFINMMATAINLQLLPGVFDTNLWEGILLFMAGLSVIGFLTLSQLPRSTQLRHPSAKLFQHNHNAYFLLAAIIAFTINLGVIWSFAERLGTHTGLNLAQVTTYLSYSMPIQALGALMATILGHRVGKTLPFYAVVIMQIAAIALLYQADPGSQWKFFAGISLWGFSWNLGIAYLLGHVATTRHAKQLLVLVPCVEAIGVSSGPAIAAFYLTGEHYLPVYATAAVGLMASAIFFLLAQHKEECIRSTEKIASKY